MTSDKNTLLNYELTDYSVVTILSKNINGVHPVISYWRDYSNSSLDIEHLTPPQLKQKLVSDINSYQENWDNEVKKIKKIYPTKYPQYTRKETILKDTYDYKTLLEEREKISDFLPTLK